MSLVRRQVGPAPRFYRITKDVKGNTRVERVLISDVQRSRPNIFSVSRMFKSSGVDEQRKPSLCTEKEANDADIRHQRYRALLQLPPEECIVPPCIVDLLGPEAAQMTPCRFFGAVPRATRGTRLPGAPYGVERPCMRNDDNKTRVVQSLADTISYTVFPASTSRRLLYRRFLACDKTYSIVVWDPESKRSAMVKCFAKLEYAYASLRNLKQINDSVAGLGPSLRGYFHLPHSKDQGHHFVVTGFLYDYITISSLPPESSAHVRETIAHNLCAALARMHAAGLAHLDIKAPNAMYHCSTLNVKLIDFDGMRSCNREEKKRNILTAFTPMYTPPELQRLTKEQVVAIDFESALRIDYFGLGLMMLGVLSNQHVGVLVTDTEIKISVNGSDTVVRDLEELQTRLYQIVDNACGKRMHSTVKSLLAIDPVKRKF